MLEADRQQVAHVLIDEAVVDHPPHLAHRHDVVTAQHTQLVRDGGIVASQSGGQVAHAQLAGRRMQQRKDDLQARRITEHREQVGDRACRFGGKQVPSHGQGMLWMNAALLADIPWKGRWC